MQIGARRPLAGAAGAGRDGAHGNTDTETSSACEAHRAAFHQAHRRLDGAAKPGPRPAGARCRELSVHCADRGQLAEDPGRTGRSAGAPRPPAGVPPDLAGPEIHFARRPLEGVHPVRLWRCQRAQLRALPGDRATAAKRAETAVGLVLDPGAALPHPGAPRRHQEPAAHPSRPRHSEAAGELQDARRRPDRLLGARQVRRVRRLSIATRSGTTPTRSAWC